MTGSKAQNSLKACTPVLEMILISKPGSKGRVVTDTLAINNRSQLARERGLKESRKKYKRKCVV